MKVDKRCGVEIGDIVEVVSKKRYNGVQYKVTKFEGPKLIVGRVTKPIATKPTHPIGHIIRLFAERLKVIERGGKKFIYKKIFTKEGGWGP